MMLSLVGCGKNTDEVTVIQIPSEEEQVEEKVRPVLKELPKVTLTIEEMQEYYDVSEFVGTPRLAIIEFCGVGEYNDELLTMEELDCGIIIFRFMDKIPEWDEYAYHYAIVLDNGTPDDYSDDPVAHIFESTIE